MTTRLPIIVDVVTGALVELPANDSINFADNTLLLGDPSKIVLQGGNNGDVLSTDGQGNLEWVARSSLDTDVAVQLDFGTFSAPLTPLATLNFGTF